jgi:hypothetical protein
LDEDLVSVSQNSDEKQVKNNGSNYIYFEIIVGVFGVISSILSVFIATFIGVTSLSLQNGALLLLLSIFVSILLVIRLINYFFNGQKRNAIICVILVVLNILFFVLKLIEFVSIPILVVA